MAVTIHARFGKNDIDKIVKQQAKALEDAILFRLQFVGEQFIADARSVNTYKDQTGNLRSSIGYVILKDGNQVTTDFKGNKEGTRKAKVMVQRLIGEKFEGHKGFALIAVAGMEYAAAVESKGKDVITGSSLRAETMLKNAFKRLAA